MALVQDEEGTDAALRFVEEASKVLVVSEYARGEAASAISRQLRMGKINLPVAGERLTFLDGWLEASAQTIDTEARDIAEGGRIVRRFEFGLRLPDAIHLAAALARGMTLVTLDRDMAKAARELGVQVVEPA